jgi:type I restriction enzyme S subunit
MLPNISIQKKISNILFKIDKKIEINNKINQKLEAMAKTLYDYWFVQFDFPNSDGKPYKSSGGKMVYSEELKREIPEGWEVNTLNSFIKITKGGDWGKENIENNYTKEVFCIRGADFNGLNGKGELKAPIRYILEKNTNKLLSSHDIIIEVSGGSPTQSTGRLTFITEETLNRFDKAIVCSNFCRAISLNEKKTLYYFVHTWNLLYDNNVMFSWEGKTSGLKNLLLNNMLKSVNIIVPSRDLIDKFYKFNKPLQAKKQKNLIENQKLTQLRDWLLPMLMNGQVRVK